MEVSSAITPRTKAIIAVHYGGGVCDISCLMDIARERDIVVIEDVAHSFLSTSRGRYAGAIGHLGAFSFDYQKNVVAGEAGALVINDQRFANRAEIIRQKGTDKNALLRGEISQYLWQDLGSSFAPSDITAAVLLAQIERADDITRARQKYWMRYHKTFEQLERAKIVQRPTVPSDVTHNGHLYYLILRTRSERDSFIAEMKEEEITTPFHFIPLDISPAGRRFGRAHGSLAVTHSVAERLVRLPLWYGMEQEQERIIEMALARLEPKTRLGRRSDRDGL